MAATAQPGNPASHPTPSASDTRPSSPPISWEGDKMFNIYIYDYCSKRGYNRTARELQAEAEIPQDSLPPINARQGLLYEWWTVFWVLFNAKNNQNPTEDGMAYAAFQAQQNQQRNLRPPGAQPAGMNPMSQPPNMARPSNNGRPGGFINGIMPPANMPPANQYPMSNGLQQPNGVMHGSGGPSNGSAPGPNPGNGQPNSFHPGYGNNNPRRESMNPPGRGNPPYGSPAMAPSPGGSGGPPQPPQPNSHMPGQPGQPSQLQQQQHSQQPPQGQQAPMAQLGGGPPQMRPPPLGGNPMAPQGSQSGLTGGNPPHTPTASFRPPSRTSSPGRPGNMTQPSPGLSHRPLGMNQHPPGTFMGGPNPPSDMITEFSTLPAALIPQLKQEVGVGDKDNSALTPDDKSRIVALYKSRARPQGPPGQQRGKAPNMLPMGGPQSSMLPPNRMPNQQPGPPPPVSNPTRSAKRNSTSPGQEANEYPSTDSSPPQSKRIKRSPNGEGSLQNHPGGPPGPPPIGAATYAVASPQPGNAQLPMQHRNFPGGSMGQSMGNMGNGAPMQGMSMGMPGGGMMAPSIQGHPGMGMPGGQTMSNMQQQFQRNQMQQYQMRMNQGMQGNAPPGGNAGSPGDPSGGSGGGPGGFNPNPGNPHQHGGPMAGGAPGSMPGGSMPGGFNNPSRLPQQKPPMAGMGGMPGMGAPSPAMNGLGVKDGPQQGKDSKPESPRNMGNIQPPPPSQSAPPQSNTPGLGSLTAPSPLGQGGSQSVPPGAGPSQAPGQQSQSQQQQNNQDQGIQPDSGLADVTAFFSEDLLVSMPSLEGVEYGGDFDREFSQWFDPESSTGVPGFEGLK